MAIGFNQIIFIQNLVERNIDWWIEWLFIHFIILPADIVDIQFLDASTHLYKRVCPSVLWFVCWSVRRSVRPSCVFSKSRKSRGNDKESLENKIWQIWQINLTNLTNLSDKFVLVPNFRRIFVRTNLFFCRICSKFSALSWTNTTLSGSAC